MYSSTNKSKIRYAPYEKYLIYTHTWLTSGIGKTNMIVCTSVSVKDEMDKESKHTDCLLQVYRHRKKKKNRVENVMVQHETSEFFFVVVFFFLGQHQSNKILHAVIRIIEMNKIPTAESEYEICIKDISSARVFFFRYI